MSQRRKRNASSKFLILNYSLIIPNKLLILFLGIFSYFQFLLQIIADDWCAKVYENIDYFGWELILPETSNGSLIGTEKDNEVSAVKINSGCTLNGYDGHGLHDLIFTYTKDDPRLFMKSGQNDEMTSYKCSCQAQGMMGFNVDVIFKYLQHHTNT